MEGLLLLLLLLLLLVVLLLLVLVVLLLLLVVVVVVGGEMLLVVRHGIVPARRRGRRRRHAQVEHGPAAVGAGPRLGAVGQGHGEVGVGHVVHLGLGGGGPDLQVHVQGGLLLLLGEAHLAGAHLRLEEQVVDPRRHAEDGREVGQGLRGGGGAGRAGRLQAGLRLDVLGVGAVQARAQVGGAGQDDVDVEAVRRHGLLLGEELVHHRGALPPVLSVRGGGGGRGHQRAAGEGEVLLQLQVGLERRAEKGRGG